MARSTPAAQEFVPLKEIRDDIAILKDGSMRAILMVSSINFALKSQDEQHAILAQFQSFLNTLDFSLQIYVQSRRLNIQPYLELLRTREPAQDNDLMRVQLREYIGFVENLTNEVEIMTKSFFVVIAYTPSTINLSGGISGIGNVFKTKSSSEADAESLARFEEDRTQIEQRVAVVTQGLNRIGVRTVTLGTNEIIELFYHLFNPGEHNKALPV
jgi:type IV secretory pathway VirB4 component